MTLSGRKDVPTLDGVADRLDQAVERDRLLEDAIGAGLEALSQTSLVGVPGEDDNPLGGFQEAVDEAETAPQFLAQVEIEEDQRGAERLGGVEDGVGRGAVYDPYVEALPGQGKLQALAQQHVVVNDKTRLLIERTYINIGDETGGATGFNASVSITPRRILVAVVPPLLSDLLSRLVSLLISRWWRWRPMGRCRMAASTRHSSTPTSSSLRSKSTPWSGCQ